MRLPITKRDETRVTRDPYRSLIDDFLKNAFYEPGYEQTKLMAMDVIERDKEYVLRANLPGMKKENIKVYIENNNLVIEAKHQEEKEEKDETMYRCERYHGDYHRVFSVPDNWNTENMQAKYENGVLNITVPKKEEKPAKQISIS